jgi:hypothetical protein
VCTCACEPVPVLCICLCCTCPVCLRPHLALHPIAPCAHRPYTPAHCIQLASALSQLRLLPRRTLRVCQARVPGQVAIPARPVWTRSEEHLLLCLETWNHFFLRTSSVSALRHQQQYRAAYRLLPTAVHRHCTALLFTGTPLASGFHIAHRCPVTVIRSGLSQALPLFELPPLRALLLPQHSLPRILHITALASP